MHLPITEALGVGTNGPRSSSAPGSQSSARMVASRQAARSAPSPAPDSAYQRWAAFSRARAADRSPLSRETSEPAVTGRGIGIRRGWLGDDGVVLRAGGVTGGGRDGRTETVEQASDAGVEAWPR